MRRIQSGFLNTQNQFGPLSTWQGDTNMGVFTTNEVFYWRINQRWVIKDDRSPIGQAEFTLPGTYTWVCPANVTNVSVVCIGGGGHGGGRGPGAGGGGLAYRSSAPVTPGNSYTIVVGATGAFPGSYANISNPGFSSSAFDCIATGGGGTSQGYVGGGPSGTFDGGGFGGKGGNQNTSSGPQDVKGGGGAGGYLGNGGDAKGLAYPRTDAQPGSGGGAGGQGVAGGGVGLYGIGADGFGSGVPGSGGSGVTYGGGGKGNTNSDSALSGGSGAVRIIWGSGRKYPSSGVPDQTFTVAPPPDDLAPVSPPGQQAYTSPGTYSWIAPAGVTSVCVVCVGAGGSGAGRGPGAGGGALAFRNFIPVTPGNSYSIEVGASPTSLGSYANNSVAGGSSSAFGTVAGGGGGGGRANFISGGEPSGLFDGGGRGGHTRELNSSGGSGGGGAGGYFGPGGQGSGGLGAFGPGTGGSGSGGTASSSGGGGVGLLGIGASGVTAGQGGSGGGSYNGVGGLYGGGGLGNNNSDSGKVGGHGAVRIIWGTGRYFPSNGTGDL